MFTRSGSSGGVLITIVVLFYFFVLIVSPALSSDKNDSGRWMGHDWVFIFSTDDGLQHNVGWGAVADSLDFNFSIFINQNITESLDPHCYFASKSDIQQLAAQGNEIGNHGYQHGRFGIDCGGDCPGQWGGLTNFWNPDCWLEGMSSEEARLCFNVEVSRDSMLNWIDLSPMTAAFPAHLHSDSVMFNLEQLGYLGARDGSGWWQSTNFTVNPLNSWDDGISLYRIPTMASTIDLWGDHYDQNGNIPQHFSVETFQAKFDSILATHQVIEKGRMFNLYAHDFGADDNRYCDRNWHRGGLTPFELAETIKYARERGAAIMTFGDAVSWYREHSTRVADPVLEYGLEFAGDLIWRPAMSSCVDKPSHELNLEQNHPNPFNPMTTIKFNIPENGHVSLGVYDLAGRLVIMLLDEWREEAHASVLWDGRNGDGVFAPSGVYYYRLIGDKFSETRKMTLVR